MQTESLPLDRQLRLEILHARECVYRYGQPTPMERMVIPPSFAQGISPEDLPEIWVKREDLSVIRTYKWRGAFNCMANLSPDQICNGVVTASAGNHAQGVALAAHKMKIPATIFMPRSTPGVKLEAVKQFGGEWVTIQLAGDSYDEALAKAQQFVRESNATYVHAYDNLKIMAGQGTMADEVVLSGQGPFDAAYLQIGGGGMAAGVSLWLKTYWSNIEIVGVEGENQASMKAAIEKGESYALHEVDLFCDGTAVKQAGDLPFTICRDTLDRVLTINNDEVSRGIRALWEGLRCVSEPSGAMGMAAVLKELKNLKRKRVLVVVTGSNVDFLKLGMIAQSVGAVNQESVTLRIKIAEKQGAMLQLLDTCFSGVNIADFQYGKIHDEIAWPVITASSESRESLDQLMLSLQENGYVWENLAGETDVLFRAIPLKGELLKNPVFLRLDFYDRGGALHDFMDRQVRGKASLCYFNYRQSGERIGRALIGLEFQTEQLRSDFLAALPESGEGYRSCRSVPENVWRRLAGLEV